MTGETIQSTVFLASNSIPSGNPQHSNQKESMERRIKHSYTKLSQKQEKTAREVLLLRFLCGATGTTFEERFTEHYSLTL